MNIEKLKSGEIKMIKVDIDGINETLDYPVSLPKKSFYIGQYQVTQSLWQKLTDENPSYFKGSSRPVESVSWKDITEIFLPRLNEINTEGFTYFLPSETEWVFAARGGLEGIKDNFIYSGSDNIREVAWYALNSDSNTKPVGLKKPNQLNIYDMSGNVWEVCRDEIEQQNHRIIKGGGCSYDDIESCRIDFKMNPVSESERDRYIGFRLIRYGNE